MPEAIDHHGSGEQQVAADGIDRLGVSRPGGLEGNQIEAALETGGVDPGAIAHIHGVDPFAANQHQLGAAAAEAIEGNAIGAGGHRFDRGQLGCRQGGHQRGFLTGIRHQPPDRRQDHANIVGSIYVLAADLIAVNYPIAENQAIAHLGTGAGLEMDRFRFR